MNTDSDKLIVTAASSAFGPSLLALLGSLSLNWPGHPPVLVYDIGLDEKTLSALAEHQISVKAVPPFCPHWRKHFTWRIWCLNDAPARDILWVDAGVVFLQDIEEVFDALEVQGYFLLPNYQLLDWEASEAACRGCGLSPEFRLGKPTLAATMMGFRKTGRTLEVLKESLSVALVEEHIVATEPTHRHDQAIISLLMYKHFRQPLVHDGLLYLGWLSPRQVPGQKVWVHRRTILSQDQAYFASHIATPAPPYLPKNPSVPKKNALRALAHASIRKLGLIGSRRFGQSETRPNDGVRD